MGELEVSGADGDGFPPYAVAACTLVYLNGAGDLVTRDLVTRSESVLAPASEHPRRPAASTELVAWQAEEAGRAVVRVQWNGAVHTVVGAFAAAGEPRVSGSAVVFTAWRDSSSRGDTDVWVHDAATGTSTLTLGGPGQQRFADISASFVVATDFAEDPDGTFDGNDTDVADIVVLDRVTGVRTTRRRAGKQAFPMLAADDTLAYLDWAAIHPEPKLEAFALLAGRLAGDPAADRVVAEVRYVSSQYARPALAGGILEWVGNPDGKTTLWRAPIDLSTSPTAVAGLDDLRLFAPAPTSGGTARGFTILAVAKASGAAPRLRAVSR